MLSSLLIICSTPIGLEDVSKFPYLIAELIDRGWAESDIKALIGNNLLRVFEEVEKVCVYQYRCKEMQSPHAESPRLSVLAPIVICVKWFAMYQLFLSRSRCTPCMSMEEGLSVLGDCNALTPAFFWYKSFFDRSKNVRSKIF